MSALHVRILEFRIVNLRDKEAFGEYYKQELNAVYRFIYTRTSSREVAEDLTGEVFLKAYQYIFEEGREVTHLRGLIFTIARTSVADHFRRSGRREEVISPQDPFFLKLVDRESSALANAEARADWELVWQKLQIIRSEYAEVITLRFIDDLSIEEISAMLGKSRGAVRVLLHRAIHALEEEVKT